MIAISRWNDREFATIIRFGVSGIACTLFAYLIYLLAFAVFSRELISVLISYLLSIPLSYHLNCRYVFRKKYNFTAYLSFVALQLGAMLLNYIILKNMNNIFPNYISAIISYATVPVVVFVVSKVFIFKK
ncbi:putative flippase GtrA [Actimicrobium sp. GrIS 1.19]|uniref:GtrA family protein n=1 Tax=Actimicrobium sp. GrIS 1.19 TaxID=3071708 RepID=UPI002E02E837|nr:putative flippase GtrA [Actimicrobium sp. GrIS 1.19]